MHSQRLAISFDRSDQVVLNFLLDRFQPLLGTICAILEVLHLSLKLRYPILRSPQLYGEPVRHRHGTLHVFLRGLGSLMEHRYDSLSRLIDWVSSILWRLLRREYKYFGGCASASLQKRLVPARDQDPHPVNAIPQLS